MLAFTWSPSSVTVVLQALESPNPICKQLHIVLEVLESRRAHREPEFAYKVILGYLQAKLEREMPLWCLSEKLHVLERAMVSRRLVEFSKQVIEIRAKLNLPPSKVFAVASTSSSSTSSVPTRNSLSTSTSSGMRPRPLPNPQFYLPIVAFKEEQEVPPPYSAFASQPRRIRESLI